MKKQSLAFEKMQRHYRQKDLAALKWKKDGGKVVGCLGLSVPAEIIMAGGCLPIQIWGDPDMPTGAGDRYMEEYFCPYVRSIHNLFIMGRYDFLDLAIFPHSTDSVKRCYFYLWTEKMNDPELKIPPLAMFDTLHTRKHIANRYVRGRVEVLKEKMEKVTDRKITHEDLARAIETCNENRILLKKIAELRKATPPRISGVEAMQIIGASFYMPKDEHNKLLLEFLEEAETLPAREGVRLFVSGSVLDNTQFYELVESCGAVIVSEDIATGNRYSDDPVDTSLEPLNAITDRYHSKSHEGRMHPLDTLIDYVVKSVQAAACDGVIFSYMQWDDSHGWNYPSQRDALEKIGIPSIVFDMQGYKLEGPEQLRTRIEAFVEMIKGG